MKGHLTAPILAVFLAVSLTGCTVGVFHGFLVPVKGPLADAGAAPLPIAIDYYDRLTNRARFEITYPDGEIVSGEVSGWDSFVGVGGGPNGTTVTFTLDRIHLEPVGTIIDSRGNTFRLSKGQDTWDKLLL